MSVETTNLVNQEPPTFLISIDSLGVEIRVKLDNEVVIEDEEDM